METPLTESCDRLLSRFSQVNVSDTRQALKAKLREAQNFVRCIQDAYNSLSPALQLPNEIWIEIGWVVLDSCKETWLPEEPNGLLKGFLPLIHISHRLRSVFCSNKKYWTYVDLESPAAKLLLQLSGNHNIRVSYNRQYFKGIRPMWSADEDNQTDCDDDNPATRKSVVRAMIGTKERIEDILIVSNYQGMQNCVGQLENHGFPQLLHLTLQVAEWSEAYMDHNLEDPYIYLNNVPLRTLRLHGVYPGFQNSCYTALRHLTLSKCSGHTLMVQMEDLAHLMLQCKLLEELYLLNAVGSLPSSSQPSQMPAKISFANLRFLSIAADKQRVVQFLIHLIQAPVLRHLHLHVESCNIHPVLLEDLIPASHSVYHSIGKIKSLLIHYYNGRVTFSTPHNFPDSWNGTAIENPDFSFKIEFQLSFAEELPFSFGTLASFIGTNLVCETLAVELRHCKDEFVDHTMEVWSTVLFPALPNLRRLNVSFRGDRNHPRSLQNVIKALTPQITQTVLCTSLEHIFLSAGTSRFDDEIAPSMGWPDVQLLQDMVKSRHSAHTPLSSLRFDTSVLPEHEFFGALVEELKGVLQDIQVVHPSKLKEVSFMDAYRRNLTNSE